MDRLRGSGRRSGPSAARSPNSVGRRGGEAAGAAVASAVRSSRRAREVCARLRRRRARWRPSAFRGRRTSPRRAACSGIRRARACRSASAVPVEQMDFEQHAARSSTVGRTPRLATPGSGSSARPCTRTTKMPASAGRLWAIAQVERGKAEIAAELRAVHDVAADRIRAAERGARRVEIARDQRGAHGRATRCARRRMRRRSASARLRSRIARRRRSACEIARALGAVAEVVADHDPARVQPVAR